LYYILNGGVALQLCYHRTFNDYTGSQSVSCVLLWQPFICIDLFVIGYDFCVMLGK